MHMLNMDGIQPQVPLSSIGIPIRTSTFADHRKHHVTLLMITDGNEEFHYLSIQSMSTLVSTGSKYKRKHYVFNYCLYPFLKEDQLKEYTIMCRQNQSQLIRYPMPGKDDVLKFTKFHYQFPVTFVIYADFECFLEKNDSDH